MRSIRRSLLGYLLVLIALALCAVGALVDRFANDAIRTRETSEVERIEQAYQVRRLEARGKFDADLTAEAKNLAGIVNSHAKSVVGQEPRRAGGGPPPKGAETKSPEMKAPEPKALELQVPAALRAGEDEARQFRLRAAVLEFARVGPPVLPARAPAAAVEPLLRGDPRRHVPYPGWAEFDGPRAFARIHDALRKALAEVDHPVPFQVTLVAVASQGGRVWGTASIGSDRLRNELPTDPPFLDPAAEQEPRAGDIDVPGLGPCRRVATGVIRNGRPNGFFVFLPSPPPPANLAQYPQHRVYPPFHGPDLIVRLVVQAVRPLSELDDRLAADGHDRDEQIARVRTETQQELAQLRGRLIAIGAVTFAALVFGGWLLVARGLAPLHTLSDAVSRVSEKDFRLPVGAEGLARELAPIHARITQTLTLLERAFAREKQAVADISHELRTPIASLLATIDVALRKPRTPEQYRTALEECRLISRQLGQLVERIMTLATLDAGNDHTQLARLDAGEVAAGCAAVIRPLAAANNVRLTIHADEGVTVETDPGKLREVLMNLLHNAVEYNRPDGTIELSARREGGAAVFEVRDTGIGMTADVRDRIFERFYRADASRHATGVHAGLGLAIVKEYVAKLNGTIAVESEPGVGTTFRVVLPLAQAAAPAADRPKGRAVPAAS